MANDISYFKVEGDETQYSFNDADLEARIGATALPTTAQTITGAIAEHEGDISTLNSQVATLDSKFTSYLPADTNIDNWNTTGFWIYQRESPYSHTGTYPISDQYGTLICVRGTSANFSMQMIRSNSTSRADGTLYIRYRTAGTWGSWLTYEDNSKFGTWQYFTPTITSPSSGFTVENVNFRYLSIGKLLWISGRFNITNAGSNLANTFFITLPTGFSCADHVGPAGQLVMNKTNVTAENAMILCMRQGTNNIYAQSGAGGSAVLNVVGTGYLLVNATVMCQ